MQDLPIPGAIGLPADALERHVAPDGGLGQHRPPCPSPSILLARDGDVVTLTFNDPTRLNAMTQAMGEAFSAGDRRSRGRREPARGGADRRRPGLLRRRRPHDDRSARRAGAANGPRGRGAIRDGMRSFYQLFLSVRDLPCPSDRRRERRRDRRRPVRGARLRRPDRRERGEARPQLHAARPAPGDGRDLDAAAAGGPGARRGDALLEPDLHGQPKPPRSAS